MRDAWKVEQTGSLPVVQVRSGWHERAPVPTSAGEHAPSRIVLAARSPLRLQLLGHYVARHPFATCVGSSNDLADVVATCRSAAPDLLVLCGSADTSEAPLSIVRELHQGQPSVAVILVAPTGTPRLAQALAAGAAGYLTGATTHAGLTRAVENVATGRRTTAPTTLRVAARGTNSRPVPARPCGPPPLTRRETDVLRLIAHGDSTQEIAARLDISVHTARSHLKSVLCKLDVHTRVHAAAVGVALALV